MIYLSLSKQFVWYGVGYTILREVSYNIHKIKYKTTTKNNIIDSQNIYIFTDLIYYAFSLFEL